VRRTTRWSVALLLVAAAAAVVGPRVAGGEPSPGAARAEVVELELPTSRGTKLQASLHRPAAGNGAAVVLAPGQGYHRGRPILVRSAEALAAAGFVALRFDWAYTAVKGQASEDLSAERDDLEAALAHVRGLEGVTKVVLAGKSLGSLVALARASEKHDDLAGLVLLTFPMHPPGVPSPRSEGVERLSRVKVPTLVIQGDADPLGDLSLLYALAAEGTGRPRVVVVPGDHGLQEGGPDDPRTAQNLRLGVDALVLFARRFVR
jgi:predicted alpha/beta-hydrolase family hydrolase